ncbi:MAG: ParB/RepB/Spo0J family partition protein [Bacillota bacterium]
MAKKGLGRGIEALIPGDDNPAGSPIVELDPSVIETDPHQPRQVFDDSKIDELASSLKEHGVIQPLIVRRLGNAYRLVAGERRLRAAVRAGIDKVPAVVREMDDREAVEISLVENLQREELGPLEQAGAFQRLADEFGLTQEEIAGRVGKSRPEVTNTIRLLRLEPEVKRLLNEGKLTGGHGRALVVLDREKQVRLAKMAVSRGLSVRKTEEMVSAEAKKTQPKDNLSRQVRRKDAEELLSAALGSPVQVKVQGPRGTITVAFFGEEDLERLLEIVQRGSKGQ